MTLHKDIEMWSFEILVDINFELSCIKKFKLTENELSEKLKKKWNKNSVLPLEKIIKFSRTFGLVGVSYNSNEYVFPLARIFSFFSSSYLKVVNEILLEFKNKKIWNLNLKKLYGNYFQEIFTCFDQKMAQIIKYREGIVKGKKYTLQELGNKWGITRERVRQIEQRFWRLFNRRKRENYMLKLLLSAFLCLYLKNSGKLIFRINTTEGRMMALLSKSLKIPEIRIQKTELLFFTFTLKNFKSIINYKKLTLYEVFPKDIAKKLCIKYEFLIKSDVKKISKVLSTFKLKSLKKSQKAFLALQSIRQPAHFSKVTEVYGKLFPLDKCTENSVHTALCDAGKYGVVWVQVRGMYALKEWGYSRDSKTLFERVVYIVKKKYKEIGKPVSKNVILAEMGKYRRIINLNSFSIALSLNPDIEQVIKDKFIPKDTNKQSENNNKKLKNMDKIIEKFWK